MVDYQVLTDPGDGSVFTRTTDDIWRLEPVAPAFGKVKFAKGTAFDLGGYASYSFADIEGIPLLTGGDVRVSGTWTVPVDQAIGGGSMRASGKVVFEDGASILVDDTRSRRLQELPILTADSIVLPDGGLPILSARGKRYCLVLSADGRTLSIRNGAGFVLTIR